MRDYNRPTDIVALLDEEHIEDFCHTFLNALLENKKINKENGFTPIVKNYEYGYYNVDYGFVVFAVEKFIRNLYKYKLENEEKGIEIAEKVHRDFALDHNEKLAKNGKLLMGILAFHGFQFYGKNEQNLYTRILFRNNAKNNFILLNSININFENVLKIANRKNINEFFNNKNIKEIEQIAYGKFVNSSLKTIGKTTPIYQFWDRQKGFNDNLFE